MFKEVIKSCKIGAFDVEVFVVPSQDQFDGDPTEDQMIRNGDARWLDLICTASVAHTAIATETYWGLVVEDVAQLEDNGQVNDIIQDVMQDACYKLEQIKIVANKFESMDAFAGVTGDFED